MDAQQFRQQLRIALEKFQEIDPAMPLSAIQTFVWVAMNDGHHQYDLEQYLGASNATASRNIQWWSNWRSFKDGRKGPNYIESFPDPMDRRFKVVQLTAQGRAFWESLGETHGKKKGKQVAG